MINLGYGIQHIAGMVTPTIPQVIVIQINLAQISTLVVQFRAKNHTHTMSFVLTRLIFQYFVCFLSFQSFILLDLKIWWYYMLELSLYWCLFFTQFSDLKRKVGKYFCSELKSKVVFRESERNIKSRNLVTTFLTHLFFVKFCCCYLKSLRAKRTEHT